VNKTRKRLSDRNTRRGFHYLPLSPSLLPFDPYSLASLSSPHREVWELSPQCGCSGCYPRILLKCNAVCSIAVYFSNKSVALHKSVVSHFVIQRTLSEMGPWGWAAFCTVCCTVRLWPPVNLSRWRGWWGEVMTDDCVLCICDVRCGRVWVKSVSERRRVWELTCLIHLCLPSLILRSLSPAHARVSLSK